MKPELEQIRNVTKRLVISLAVCILASIVTLIAFLIAGKPVNMMIVAIAFGIIGGFVSLQRRLRTLSSDDVELLATSWPFVFLAPLTGGVLAGIFYVILISGIISGEIFPLFDTGDETKKDFSRLLDCTARGYQDYAKIIVWSFIAGFSESFVTNIIGGLTKSGHGGSST